MGAVHDDQRDRQDGSGALKGLGGNKEHDAQLQLNLRIRRAAAEWAAALSAVHILQRNEAHT